MAAPSQSSAQTYYFEDLAVGMAANFTKIVTETDLAKFAEASGDHNPLHFDDAFAEATIFKGRIVHGMLYASFISATFAGQLPGPGGIYVSQNLIFRAPVRIGAAVTANVEITSLVPEKNFVIFKTQCTVGGKLVLDGEATLMVRSRNAQS